MKLLVNGKVKEVYELDAETLRFKFTDKISVFDKVIPSMIPRKGEALCRMSAHWFKLAKENGIDSHFIDMPSANEMDVKRVEQPRKLDMPDSQRKNVMFPLEFICRHFVAGSMWDRLQKGKVKKEELGITGELEYGMRIPEPFFEVTTKHEEYDRPITFDEAINDFGLKREEIEEVRELVLKMDTLISSQVEPRGLLHVDGKKEFALGDEGQLMLIDTFGTPDEDRFWDVEEYTSGKFTELSKEYVRQYYRLLGYHKELTEAREKGIPTPDIPALPDNMIEQTTMLYADLFQRLTGQEL